MSHDLGRILMFSQICWSSSPSYKWKTGCRCLSSSSGASDSDTRVVTPESWHDDRDTLTHQSPLMRCQMFHVPMSVLWLVTLLLLLAVYTLLFTPPFSALRTTIQDPPWTAAAEAAWAWVSLTPRAGIICLAPACWHWQHSSPNCSEDTQAPTLFPVLTLYQRTWGTLTHLCRIGSHAAFEDYLLLSDDESETLIMQSRMSLRIKDKDCHLICIPAK